MRKSNGFTLLEMLLVLVIMSSIILMFMNFTTTKATETQRDIVVMQTQQMLNAGLAYYISNGSWPVTCGTVATIASSSSNNLQPNYIPGSLNYNSYGKRYQMNCATPVNGGNLFVITPVDTSVNAMIIAGRLPLAYVTTAGAAVTTPPTQASGCATTGGNMPASSCTYVVSSVNAPGQNLNNARSANFAGVYHPGGCIPVPNCPTNMKPQVFLSVAQIMGTNDATATGGTPNVYPITNFTAYATGGTGAGTSPGDCNTGSSTACSWGSGVHPAADYWRACLTIGTEDGSVTNGSGSTSWAQWQSIVAMTRCAPTNEASGSDLAVWLP